MLLCPLQNKVHCHLAVSLKKCIKLSKYIITESEMWKGILPGRLKLNSELVNVNELNGPKIG